MRGDDSMDDQRRAKELFTAYLGHFNHMYREGVLEEYKGYDIAQEIETGWLDEMVDSFTKELSIMNWNGVIRLEGLARSYSNPTILENVVTFASRHLMSADSLVKLVYAEKMIELIQLLQKKIPLELLYKAYKSTIEILEDTITKPLLLDPGHKLAQFNLKDKKALNTKARRDIDELKQFIAEVW
jgi:hypothetical protein